MHTVTINSYTYIHIYMYVYINVLTEVVPYYKTGHMWLYHN